MRKLPKGLQKFQHLGRPQEPRLHEAEEVSLQPLRVLVHEKIRPHETPQSETRRFMKIVDVFGGGSIIDCELPCPVCKKKYKGVQSLRIHLSRCSDERKFSCTFCASKFKRNDHLKRHIQHVHGSWFLSNYQTRKQANVAASGGEMKSNANANA